MADRQRAFNRDMGAYLSKKRKPKPAKISFVIEKKQEVEIVPELSEGKVHVIKGRRKPSFWKSIFAYDDVHDPDELTPEQKRKFERVQDRLEHINAEEEGLDDLHEALEVERESLLSRMFSWLRTPPKEPDYPILETPEKYLDEDVRDVFKMLHKWLEKLPPRVKKEFKSSEDFKSYREILDKYELLKK